MMGKSHVLVNSCILFDITLLQHGKEIYASVLSLKPHIGVIYSLMNFSFLYSCFLLGSLLPDIDSKHSTLGRYMYLPLGHRTWTHSVWFLILLFPVCFVGNFGKLLFFGYFLHLLADSMSAAGICWFYPIMRYREYSSGARVVDGHWFKLYHTGKDSETWFVFFILCVTIIVVPVLVIVLKK